MASARDILSLLQDAERHLGRRRHRRWAARSIDLDVVLHGDLVGGGSGLIVPHPRYTARQFVLQPACDVAAEYRDPRFGWTLRQLTDHVSAGAPSLALQGGDVATRIAICDRLSVEHGIRVFADRDIPESVPVVGNAPGYLLHHAEKQIEENGEKNGAPDSVGFGTAISLPEEIRSDENTPWVSAFVPPLPKLGSNDTASVNIPRLVGRMQRATAESRWPAPHQMWPTSSHWPEYRLEIDDLDWAVGEIVSALESMRCEVRPVTDDGNWWR
jgi:2-amino-4-hydroxy-6-hydroxymethyldihydropteridine diphosphokinase